LAPGDAVEIIFRFDINDPEKTAEIMDEYEDTYPSPAAAAERGYIDEVVNPRATRGRLSRVARYAAQQESPRTVGGSATNVSP
jgi:propionyl-CoA carboxylase beta chain